MKVENILLNPGDAPVNIFTSMFTPKEAPNIIVKVVAEKEVTAPIMLEK
jgi:hypothetical protein